MPKMKGLYNTIMKTTNKINNRTAFEDKLMEKLFDPNIMSSILNQNHTNTFHNRKNNTDISLIDRTINSYQHARDASIFDVEDDEKQEIIENEIMDRIERIASWLRSNTRNRLTLNSTQDKIIGHGISNQNNTIKELNTQDLTIILEKDDNNLAGFKCVTTYPNISKYSKTATPTGRNLLPDLIQTRTFKQADTQQRIQLVNAVNKGLKPNTDPITWVMDKVYCDIITHPDFNPDNMTLLYDHNNILMQDKSNYSNFNLTPNKQQFHNPNGTLCRIVRYSCNKRDQYLSQIKPHPKTTKPKNIPQDSATQIKEPEPNIPKPVQTQPNPITKSKTPPQNVQTTHVDQRKPDKPKINRRADAEATFGCSCETAEDTDDFSL